MNYTNCVETLTNSGDIPADSEVVSTNNKIVIISHGEKLVARIGSLVDVKERDDPHDLRYSHRASWLAGEVAPVVKPLHEEPLISGDYVISSYPLLDNKADLSESNAKELYHMTHKLGDALAKVEAGMTLRRLNVEAYVGERLNFMLSNPEHFDQRLVDYVSDEFDRMSVKHPFNQLTQDDTAMVHGDFKADNVVLDYDGSLKTIDLDAAAVGPRLYDLASWRLRRELGDKAPIETVVDMGRHSKEWNEDSFRSLVGWKALSSMSFTLRYESPDIYVDNVARLARSAILLGGIEAAPTPAAV